VTRIYAFANQKGGVGKTTTTVNLGAYLAAAGRAVLIIDADPQANATTAWEIGRVERFSFDLRCLIGRAPLADVVIQHRPASAWIWRPAAPALAGAEVEMVSMLAREHLMRKVLDGVAEHYDYVLIDCPPSLGLLTINALTAARNGVVVPISVISRPGRPRPVVAHRPARAREPQP